MSEYKINDPVWYYKQHQGSTLSSTKYEAVILRIGKVRATIKIVKDGRITMVEFQNLEKRKEGI